MTDGDVTRILRDVQAGRSGAMDELVECVSGRSFRRALLASIALVVVVGPVVPFNSTGAVPTLLGIVNGLVIVAVRKRSGIAGILRGR